MDFEQLGRGDGHETVPPGGAARGKVVEDVRGTADVVVIGHAATDPHATVDRRGDEDHLVVST